MRNQAAQRHRINRVINFTRTHLGQDLDLDALSDIACLSKFHFTRVFEAHMRESPTRFLARLRLERAARAMVFLPDLSVTRVSMDCGFSSPEAFSHAFRNRFGHSPRAYKRSNQGTFTVQRAWRRLVAGIYDPMAPLYRDAPDTPRVRIEYRPEYAIAYIRHVGPYGDVGESISQTFQRLQRWAEEKGLLMSETSFLGVCQDHSIVTPAERCIYDPGIVLPDLMREDNIVSIRTVSAGMYAVLPVVCQPVQLRSMWRWLSERWLPGSGWQMSFRPGYEFFPGFGGRPVTAALGAELCMPVVRAGTRQDDWTADVRR